MNGKLASFNLLGLLIEESTQVVTNDFLALPVNMVAARVLVDRGATIVVTELVTDFAESILFNHEVVRRLRRRVGLFKCIDLSDRLDWVVNLVDSGLLVDVARLEETD